MTKDNKDAAEDYSALIEAALNVRKYSYSPYSNFKVGAAVLASSGKIYTGTNIENASFPATICAERVAFTKALSEGEKDLRAIAITSSYDEFVFPCGVCRQFMVEFNPQLTVILAVSKEKYEIHKLKDLLPYSFTLK
ncbi:MAG: cytidine deaminase [Bacteroidetes bacterium]|nr:cytidine deaminase [Bacteroidota bacterium]MBX7046188.1 cytidine deaminase [Ignavibacteria bacterium]